VGSASIIYRQRPDATPKGELSTVSACYRFILDCHAKKKGACPGAPDDVRKGQDAHTAAQKYNG